MWGTDSWADPNVLFGPYDWNPGENATTEYCSWDGPTVRNCQYHKIEDGLIHRAHAAGATVYPSLGGWSLSDPFPAMAANETSRLNFASNCAKLILDYGFDGLDVDWEVSWFGKILFRSCVLPSDALFIICCCYHGSILATKVRCVIHQTNNMFLG